MNMMLQVRWLEQQYARTRVKRDVRSLFNDPMWPQQWYLVSIHRHTCIVLLSCKPMRHCFCVHSVLHDTS